MLPVDSPAPKLTPPKREAASPAAALPPLELANFRGLTPGTPASTATPVQEALTTSYANPQAPGTDRLQAYQMYGEQQADAAAKAKDESEAKAKYDAAVHDRALGTDVQGPRIPGRAQGVGVEEVAQLSWDDYNALSPTQRAAVDFNTMLVHAVRKDMKHQDDYDPTKQQQSTYDDAVQKMFGEDRPADFYAPETMGVLRQIGYSDDSAKLNDFLHLNAAITDEDLKGLGVQPPRVAETPPAPWEVPGSDPTSVRSDLVQTLADKTATMQAALVKGNQLIQSIQQTAALERNDSVADPSIGMGGIANNPKPILGYGTGEVDAYFQKAFDILANKENSSDRSQILATMNSELSPQEFDSFMAYADNRSANAERYGLALGQDEGVKYRSPEQFRKLLGLSE